MSSALVVFQVLAPQGWLLRWSSHEFGLGVALKPPTPEERAHFSDGDLAKHPGFDGETPEPPHAFACCVAERLGARPSASDLDGAYIWETAEEAFHVASLIYKEFAEALRVYNARKAKQRPLVRVRDGALVDPLALTRDQINMDTVFWSLATKVRFNGHLEFPWTVGLHSIVLAQYVALETRDFSAFRAALLHDAAEAYVGDLVHPMKAHPRFAAFVDVDSAITSLILQREGLPPQLPEIVVQSDRRIATNEYKLFHATAPGLDSWLEPLPPYVDPLITSHAERSTLAPAQDWFRYAYDGLHSLYKITEDQFPVLVDVLQPWWRR